MALDFNEEYVRGWIADNVEKIYSEADPDLLNKYRRVFKKEVSLMRRSYFSAYLLMLATGALQGGKGGAARNNGRTTGSRVSADRKPLRSQTRSDDARAYSDSRRSAPAVSARNADAEARKDAGPPQLPDDEAARIFISAGRSRRVFPREILGLILSRTGLERDDIGFIKIMDNYSFVQIKTEKAENVIEALNGYEYRGRPLTVNYARPRSEMQGEETRSADDNRSEGDSRPVEDAASDEMQNDQYQDNADDYSGSADNYSDSDDEQQDHND
jgi:RNA recognition motif-containing protein